MYTQCPDCGVAFRVTAEVLKQAAGKVRCGGCGVAFNALEHLSEGKPDAPARKDEQPDPALPELKPEEPGELEADTPPASISAEQSAALLKTLDQLAGEDIRIEDTGVEWRVVDDDDVGGNGEDADEDPPADDADTADEPEADPEPSQGIEEMRFDDNTPLPEDFDLADVTPAPVAPAPQPEPQPEPEPQLTQVDLAFGDPDEWDDLLGDIDEPAAIEESEPELDADDAGDADEPQDDDSEVEEAPAAEIELPGDGDAMEDIADTPPDMDTQFALQAEAMGIDLSGIHDSDDGEPEDADAEPAATEQDDGEKDPDVTELALESDGDDDGSPDEDDDDSDSSIEEDLMAAAFEAEAAVREMEESGSHATLGADKLDDDALDDDIEIDLREEEEDEPENDVEDIALGFDDSVEADIENIATTFDKGEDEPTVEAELDSGDDAIPEMSEEEKTINMMIDQDLLAIAVEDDDGFTSTIVGVQPDKDVEDEIESNKKDKKDRKKKDEVKDKPAKTPAFGAPAGPVETIVMEGESFRDSIDLGGIDDGLDDPGVSLPLGQAKDDYARRGEISHSRPGAGMIAGAVVLLLVLAAQVMHQSREALATVPLFNDTVGPLYRALGMPLTPTWDIQGWRFEATKGDVDESGEMLTIYSRVGNKSDSPLPYPLVRLALTDRFEEPIGSTVLEPGDYLPENADPRKLVPPGNTFNAVISIASPSPDATSFKLNVCYRVTGGQLRCQDEAFR